MEHRSWRSRIGATALVCVALASAFPETSRAQDPPAAGRSALLLDGAEPGGQILFRAPDRIEAEGDVGRFVAYVQAPSTTYPWRNYYEVKFHAPGGVPLLPGRYEHVEAGGPNDYSFQFSGDGHSGCDGDWASYTIHEYEFDEQSSEPDRFAADFEYHDCGNDSLGFVTHGSVRFQSTVPIHAIEATTSISSHGDVRPVRVSNIGVETEVLGLARITGPDADDYVIGPDSCSLQTLAKDSSCVVGVRIRGPRPTPTLSDSREPTTLEIPDSTVRGKRVTRLGGHLDSYRLWTVAGSAGTGAADKLGMTPVGLGLRGGLLYIADDEHHAVQVLDLQSGELFTLAGRGEPGFADTENQANRIEFTHPRDIAIDRDGDVYMTDGGNGLLRRERDGDSLSLVAGGLSGFYGPEVPDGALQDPWGVATDDLWNLYWSESESHRLWMKEPTKVPVHLAGSGTEGSSGDGGPARDARLSSPRGVSTSPTGVVYVADTGNNKIRRIDRTGIITTFAGNGSAGSGGDGGSAIAASLSAPSGVDVATDGSVFIADTGNGRVRKVALDGTITTVAGGGTSDTDGPALSVRLAEPMDVVSSSNGTVFVAERSGHRVRAVSNGEITTVAGNGTCCTDQVDTRAWSAQLTDPRGVAVDGDGGYYISDAGAHRVRHVQPDGSISTVAGSGRPGFTGDGGQAANAKLQSPTSLAVDDDGRLYISDTGNNRVRRVDSDGAIATVAGGGSGPPDGRAALDVHLEEPIGIDVHPSRGLFISDAAASAIYRVDDDGRMTVVSGTPGISGFKGDGGPATRALLDNPNGLDVHTDGSVYIADTNNNRIRMIDVCGIIGTIAGDDPADDLVKPEGIAKSTRDRNIAIANTGRNRVGYTYFDPGEWPHASNTLDAPRQVTFSDSDERILFADSGHGWIRQKVNSGGFLDVPNKCKRGEFHPSRTVRVMDSRRSSGGSGPVAPGAPRTLNIRGRGEPWDAYPPPTAEIPFTGVEAVAVDVTALGAQGSGVVTLGSTQLPGSVKALNYKKGAASSNIVVARIGSAGKIVVNVSGAATDVVLDVVGWFADGPTRTDEGHRLTFTTPVRLVDTRSGTNAPKHRVAPSESIRFSAARTSDPTPYQLDNLLLRVTSLKPTTNGKLVVRPVPEASDPEGERFGASTLSFAAGGTAQSVFYTTAGPSAQVEITNVSTGSTDVLVDMIGWTVSRFYDAKLDGFFRSVAPARIIDTETGVGVTRGPRSKGTFNVKVTGNGGVPLTGARAVVLNVTATKATSEGHLNVYEYGESVPAPKTLLYPRASPTSVMTVVEVGDGGRLRVYNSGQQTHVKVDVLGWYTE